MWTTPKEELTWAIQVTKWSAPGPDKIHNEMLKRLPPEGLDSFLALYNKIWHQGYLPENWLESTLIPISKPGKDATNHSNYRPVALTIVLCNVMERTVDVGLLDFLTRKEHCRSTMWRQSRRINYRPSFVSGSYSKQGPIKQGASCIHLLRHEKSIRFNTETRHPNLHKRSWNRTWPEISTWEISQREISP